MPFFKIAIRVVVYSALLLSLLDSHATDALGQASHPLSQTAQLTVAVTDPAGAVIPNAEVTVNGQKSVSTKTLQDGMARVLLPFGTYDITVSSRGFKTVKCTHYSVDHARAFVDVALPLGRYCDDCGDGEGLIVSTISSDLRNELLHYPAESLPMGGGPYNSLGLFFLPDRCPKDQPKTESALLDLEHHWADALTHKDVGAVACILADEFEDADVDGSVHTRAEALAKIPQRKPWTNRLTDIRAHVEGNSGFARGLNEVLDADGKVVARVRFTDIFTYRDGRWQALAGHETLVGEAHR